MARYRHADLVRIAADCLPHLCPPVPRVPGQAWTRCAQLRTDLHLSDAQVAQLVELVEEALDAPFAPAALLQARSPLATLGCIARLAADALARQDAALAPRPTIEGEALRHG